MPLDCSIATDSPSAAPDDRSVCRLYTPAMLAELVGVPASTIRRWQRRGVLQAAGSVGRLQYFDFEEVAVARRLAQLRQAGCSLRTIDRRLAELARLAPHVERPLADPSVVVEGRRLFLRRGEDLAEPGGQLLLDFDAPPQDEDDSAAVIAMFPAGDAQAAHGDDAPGETLLDRLQQDALDAEDEGRLDRAAEAYRTMLMAGGPQAEIQFALADLLYRSGDLPAARERYYAALELDEEFVEARSSLGCVLAELGELELAAATFEGALTYHAEFADVHFHLAHALERLGRDADAGEHYRTFLALAPQSPWADAARDRLLAHTGAPSR
jgi:tetratricopeptide (TPR) repeat protein